MEHYLKYIRDGYTEEQAFYLAEVKTTQKILEDLGEREDYAPTLLLNSLLSMVVLPYEKVKNDDSRFLSANNMDFFKNELGVIPDLFIPISKCKDCKITYSLKNAKTFVNKLRNGIAHQNIKVAIVEDKDFRITIKNKYASLNCNNCPNPVCKKAGLKRENGGVIDFEVTVTVEQLKKLADYISSAYLRAIQQEKK